MPRLSRKRPTVEGHIRSGRRARASTNPLITKKTSSPKCPCWATQSRIGPNSDDWPSCVNRPWKWKQATARTATPRIASSNAKRGTPGSRVVAFLSETVTARLGKKEQPERAGWKGKLNLPDRAEPARTGNQGRTDRRTKVLPCRSNSLFDPKPRIYHRRQIQATGRGRRGRVRWPSVIPVCPRVGRARIRQIQGRLVR